MIEVGQHVGNILITGRLGHGGMGEVWVGFDERLQRPVALKALRHDRVHAEARSRMLREARALSHLDHPHICRIHGFMDGEETDLLVLERIEGVTLREALARGWDARDRLRVARELTSAIAAAHARGVIHRDLKPDNVMITKEGSVKVVDFGLARLLLEEPRVARVTAPPAGVEEGPVTQVVPAEGPGDAAALAPPLPRGPSPSSGPTLAPVSGESPALYTEALATRDGSVLGTAGYMSPEQARGEPVAAPGDVYSLGLVLQELFTGQAPYPEKIDPFEQLMRATRGETLPPEGLPKPLAALITVMKASDPEARPTAAQVSERLTRWATRWHRRAVRVAWVAGAVLLAAAGLKYTADLREERNRALAAQAAAEQSRREAERVSEFLLGVFKVASPRQDRGEKVTARELLDRGAEKIRTELTDQPSVQARLARTIGVAQCQIGLFEQGERMLRDSLATRERTAGPDGVEVADGLVALGQCLWFQDRSPEAEELLRRAVAIFEATLGAANEETAEARSVLGLILWRIGRYPEAEQAHREALAVRERLSGPESLEVAGSLNNLAEVLKAQDRLEECEALLRRALAIKETHLGTQHASVGTTLNNLGDLCYKRKRFDEAEALFLRAMAIDERAYGPDHPEIGNALNNLASLYDDQGRQADSERLYLRSRRIFEKAFGKEHMRVAVVDNNLGEIWLAAGRRDEAQAAFTHALAVFERALGPRHPFVAHPLTSLARIALARHDVATARSMLNRALAIREAALPADHPDILEVKKELAGLPR